VDHGALLLVELGGLLLGMAVLARVASRLHVSPIPLYVLAGLAFGNGGLVPLATSGEFLEVGAELGVLLLLLLLGMEYSGDELVQGLRSTFPVALVDLALNLGGGVVAGLLLGMSPVGAVVLGGVTYASSSGIVAKMVSDLGWLGNRETPVVLGLLVTEDLAMAVYLPVLGVLLAGAEGGSTVLRLGAAVGAAALVLILAIRFGGRLSAVLATASAEALLLGALGLTLLVGGLAQAAQVSSAIGAFMVGIALSGTARDKARGLLEPLRDLFAAVFFTFFSLVIAPASILPVLLPATVLAVVTGAGKGVTAWYAGHREGLGAPARRRAGALLAARGEFSIVVANLGIAAGLDRRIGGLAAAYVLLLAIAGPVLVRLSAHGIGRGPVSPRHGVPAVPDR
jgi:monovalent cation:H+ antiporter-2, CPA2 family